MHGLRFCRVTTFLLSLSVSTFALAPVAIAADNTPKVTLVSSGAGKKVPLRLRVKKGQAQRITLTTNMQMSMQVNGKAAPNTEIPPVVQTMTLTAVSIAKNGDIDFVATFDQPTLGEGGAPEVRDAILTELKGMGGLKMEATVNTRGIHQKMVIRGKDQLSQVQQQLMADLERSVSQMSQPFPKEAIGTGAKWTTETHATINGIPMITLAQYELTAFNSAAGTYALNVMTSVRTDANSVTLPQPRIELNIDTLAGKGTGKTSGKTGFVMPLRASIGSTVAIGLSGNIPAGGPISLQMNMTMNMNMKTVHP